MIEDNLQELETIQLDILELDLTLDIESILFDIDDLDLSIPAEFFEFNEIMLLDENIESYLEENQKRKR
ncbi:hypothetical protein ACTO1Y_07770 [Streptococcus sp. V728]|uniref:hypothetical protein n=1 Tax=Streptococcus sp. V728 TaxID=3455700 RepID=UPI003F91B0E8